MSATGPQLRDIRLPQVSWWPPAIGWWVLAAVVLLALIAAVLVWLRGRNARALRRAARNELASLSAQHARDGDGVALAAGLSLLLRRIALRLQPDVVADNRFAWREFLSARAPAAFSDEQLDALTDAPYRARASFDARALIDATHRWCDRALQPRALRTDNPP
jgi:hypothetical protein